MSWFRKGKHEKHDMQVTGHSRPNGRHFGNATNIFPKGWSHASSNDTIRGCRLGLKSLWLPMPSLPLPALPFFLDVIIISNLLRVGRECQEYSGILPTFPRYLTNYHDGPHPSDRARRHLALAVLSDLLADSLWAHHRPQSMATALLCLELTEAKLGAAHDSGWSLKSGSCPGGSAYLFALPAPRHGRVG